MADLGELIQRVQRREGKRQADIAADLRISPEWLSRIRHGTRPALWRLRDLAARLETSVEDVEARILAARVARLERRW